LLAQAQKKMRNGIFFSATLTPMDYFRYLLGGEEQDYTLKLASPFPRENLFLLVNDRIATRYKYRSESYGQIVNQLHAMVSAKTGNYMVFFPSYAYMDAVYTKFTEKHPEIKTQIQSQDMDEQSRDVFLQSFVDKPNETLLVFVVLGGVFSEGIDLKGERLIGVAVVGVGLPMVCAEREVLFNYFNDNGQDGFAFAYIYPGMNKVMQAAGRVIRTETDRGVVLLMDSRFSENAYKGLFPPEWAGYTKIKNEREMVEILKRFSADAPI